MVVDANPATLDRDKNADCKRNVFYYFRHVSSHSSALEQLGILSLLCKRYEIGVVLSVRNTILLTRFHFFFMTGHLLSNTFQTCSAHNGKSLIGHFIHIVIVTINAKKTKIASMKTTSRKNESFFGDQENEVRGKSVCRNSDSSNRSEIFTKKDPGCWSSVSSLSFASSMCLYDPLRVQRTPDCYKNSRKKQVQPASKALSSSLLFIDHHRQSSIYTDSAL